MKQFGNDVICIDATHSTNICNFLLITIMVIDSYGEGVPVAWAISSNDDSCTLIQFFKPLYERVGNIKPKISCQMMLKHTIMPGVEFLSRYHISYCVCGT